MSELNTSQFLALRIRQAAETLRSQVEKMGADRAAWRPEVGSFSARSALDQVKECATMNEWGAAIFASRVVRDMPPDEYDRKVGEARSAEETLDWLEESAAALSMAVAGFPSAIWGTVVAHPLTREPATWAEVCDHFYWNLVYHTGQVCFIQTLYGDLSFP